MYKSTLRRKYKLLRDSIDQSARELAEAVIAKRVIDTEQFQSSDTLFTFVPFGSEVGVAAIVDKALELKKSLAVPYVINKQEMCFIYINSFKELKKGSYGIMEPVFDLSNVAIPTENTLMLVPGLAFDAFLNRLGYGGGYYDRYLAQYPQPYKVGIGFFEQYTQSHLPHTEKDITLDIIITQSKIIKGAIK